MEPEIESNPFTNFKPDPMLTPEEAALVLGPDPIEEVVKARESENGE